MYYKLSTCTDTIKWPFIIIQQIKIVLSVFMWGILYKSLIYKPNHLVMQINLVYYLFLM